MSDIVKWLRTTNPCGISYQQDAANEIERLQYMETCWKAEIERLRAELAAVKTLLREADTEITTWMYHGHGSTESGFGSAPLLNRIRAALGIAKE